MKLLSAEQKNFYNENGFLKLGNIFSQKEIDELSSDYNELFERKNAEKAHIKAIWKGSWQNALGVEKMDLQVQSIHNLQFHYASFMRAIINQNLLDAVEDIMDSPNIILHHTKAHLKPPSQGAPFPFHQDFHYFPYEKDSMVAVFIHLDDTNPENGGLAVFPGSQKLGPLKDFSDQPGFHYVDQDQYKMPDATPVHAKKGDVVIFSYLLVHGSYINQSDRARRMFLIQLASADDKPLVEKHLSPGAGLVLRGRNVGRDANLNRRHEIDSSSDAKFQ